MKPLIGIFALSLLFFFSCDSGHPDKRITAENAYEGVNIYCHDVYDWSAAKDNRSVMNVEMGAESDSAYEVVFRSYTGATVHFYIDKKTGNTRMVEKVPVLNIENEAGTIDLLDYLDKRETRKRVNSNLADSRSSISISHHETEKTGNQVCSHILTMLVPPFGLSY